MYFFIYVYVFVNEIIVININFEHKLTMNISNNIKYKRF